MGAKARCSICREYKPKETMLRSGLGVLGGICSDECLEKYKEKYRKKRTRRKENRERQYTGGRRLPGTCRDRVKRRDKGCRWCGTTENLNIHHVFYRSEGGADTPRNLITLCATCHLKAHSNKKKYQPILLTWLWIYYVQERNVMVETVFRQVQWHQTPNGYWAARKHSDWVQKAREYSRELHAKKAEAEAEAAA